MTISCPVRQDRTAYESGLWENRHSLRPGGIDLTARAIAFCRLQPGARLLDVGCGSGESTECLSRMLGFDAIGTDLSVSACNSARRRSPEFAIVRADAIHLPFASASMDALIAECVLSLIDDRSAALAECNRVLKPDGRLAIADMYARRPDGTSLRSLDGTCVSGIVRRPELQSELAEHGFSMEVWEDHSNALRELAARFVFEQGSLEQMWASSDAKPNESQELSETLKVARPGYFLLIAVKREGEVHRGEQP
ncbi:MAG TPA: class I SAM-dependent methyltransferase [Terriglobales bacterium]|nr:class I SAM-dependent methyltransferase [Terriglobales bacterium]